MASMREIRARIRSVKSTQQITKTMKMVASAKLHRTQSGLSGIRSFARRSQHVLAELMAGENAGYDNEFLLPRKEVRTVCYVLFVGNRGLCGVYNHAVLRHAQELVQADERPCTVVVCGSYGMAEGFDESSTQCSILYNISSGAAAGTTVSLEDSQGNVLLSYEAPNSFSSVTLSTPEMKLGESYLVVIGDKVEQITLDETSASYGDAASGGFGGNMNWGGMQHRDDFQGFENADGTMPERPEQPEGETGGHGFGGNGERPQRPDFSGEAPTPPEGMEEGTEPPAMSEDGTMPEAGSTQPMGGRPGGGQEQQSAQQIAQGESAAEKTASTITGETWLLVALSAAALIAGLILAIRYKQD